MNGEIRDAVVLLAGAGSRLTTARATPKPLVPVLGTPLIAYVLHALNAVGVQTVHAIVGAHADEVIRGATERLPAGMSLRRIDNPRWQMQNGISLLCAADVIDRPFLLTMGDHLFDPAILRTLLARADSDRLNLAIDRNVNRIFDLADAVKVRTRENGIVAISKSLTDFDAVDTGVFVCAPAIFSYLERAQLNGDCSLADGVQLMANDGNANALDIGDAWWQDVDTPAMLALAEATLPEPLRAIAAAPAVCG